MNIQAQDRIAKIRALVIAARQGVIDYSEAKQKAQPLIDEINTKGKAMATKYKMKYKPVSFSGFAR
jgi:hypothetical protein